jgi:hypothetical protein
MSRTFALLAAIFMATVAMLPTNADAATLSLVGSSTKVCQLIGEYDWASGGTNQPTAARTLTNFGLEAVDLGFPVDSGSALFFLFGDAWPANHPPVSALTLPPDDALGWTTRTAPPDSKTCLDLELSTSAQRGDSAATDAPRKGTFAHPIVAPPIQQGFFNVPSGGVFLDDKFYAFFWTDHCWFPGIPLPGGLNPSPDAPLTLPPPSPFCPEVPESNSVGRSVLAQATRANPVAFRRTPNPPSTPPLNVPSGFVYVSAAKPSPENARGLDLRQSGIPVFGVARYRASIPYLALAPRDTFGDPETWSFFAGRVAGQQPIWITRRQWESGRNANGEWKPPAGAELYDAQADGDRCVGEHSATWNAPLQTWLLLYNCVGTIEARFAPEPWGPWSRPIVLLSGNDLSTVCTLIMSPLGCLGLQNYWGFLSSPTLPISIPGNFYAPFVLDRFTQNATPPGAGQPKRATIYWLVSTWNPYVIVVMQSTLALSE